MRRASSIAIAQALAIVALMVLEPKSVSYSANGQETGFMLLWSALALWLSMEAPSKRWIWWGIVAAALQWTRPEGVLYMLVFVLANLIFPMEARRKAFVAFVKAGVLGAAMYLPWTIFTWVYYGSPIPQTIRAKAVLPNAPHSLGALLGNIPVRCAASLESIFANAGWPGHIHWVAMGIATWGLFCWMIPGQSRISRIASLCFMLLSPYFAYLAVDFGWYYPPFAMCALVALCAGGDSVVRKYAPELRIIFLTLLGLIIVERGVFMVEFTRAMKAQQAVIEDGNRKLIGLYLHERVKPSETVMLECLGYIGYFSNAHMLEWPGLVSPQVTKVLREGVSRMELIDRLRPDWVVLRPVADVQRDPRFAEEYELDRVFDVSDKVAAYGEMPGTQYESIEDVSWCFIEDGGGHSRGDVLPLALGQTTRPDVATRGESFRRCVAMCRKAISADGGG